MMNSSQPITLFWFRRDLRLEDNCGLYHALISGYPVLPLFIYDSEIISDLPANDPRLAFISAQLNSINEKLKTFKGLLLVREGKPFEVIKSILDQFHVKQVFWNHDYEPYAIKRDSEIEKLLASKGIGSKSFKDQVIFEKSEVVKQDGKPYTVYTPYSRKWFELYEKVNPQPFPSEEVSDNYFNPQMEVQNTKSVLDKFKGEHRVKSANFSLSKLSDYDTSRDFPANSTSGLGPHLRFGTLGIRNLFQDLEKAPLQFRKELIWREFFMQILFHFPHVLDRSFRKQYDSIRWENDQKMFEKWKLGQTGYPIVDAGMRELNETGTMHNRVRMITASFLCKHLLVDWRWGEAYFAEKLLDFELSSNNGNWQWVAGSGCDAAPYFRVFNPESQQKKFDPNFDYIKRWVPEFGTKDYPEPIIDHAYARKRVVERYKEALYKETVPMGKNNPQNQTSFSF